MSKDEYLITDAPLKALTVFAMPMILGSFFQQIYNMADSIIVGQFVGSSALAAVGACAALTNVFICVALGAGVGAGVLVSRYFGAREYGKMKTIVSTSLFSFLILSIVLGVFGFCFSHWMMSVLQTPGDILFYPQLGVKLCSMAGGGVQKIYMVFFREPSRRDRSGSDLFHLRDGFEIKMNFDRNVSCLIAVYALMDNDFFNQAV